MTRSRSSSPAPDVFPSYLFVYLFIFFAWHATIVVVVVTGFILKRLFASVATVCLEVGPSAVKHHRFFLEYMYYTAILQLPRKSDRNFRSSPEVGDASSKSSCRHFSLPWCTPYVNVKLSGAFAELKITYQLYVIVCCVSIQEKVRRSPKGFVRNGNEREKDREGGEGGAEMRSRETSSKTNWLEGPH